MQKINIIHVGEFKEKYFIEATAEYEKRIKPFFEIKNVAIKEEKAYGSISTAKIGEIIKKESTDILSVLNEKSFLKTYNIALCVEGKKITSEKFAALFVKDDILNSKAVNFIIGGSHGLSDELKKKCHFLLSFSDFTFPHQLMRVILMEQIYRAATINGGIKYHK